MLSPAQEIKAAFERAPVPVWRRSGAIGPRGCRQNGSAPVLGRVPIDGRIDARLRGDSIDVLCALSIFVANLLPEAANCPGLSVLFKNLVKYVAQLCT